MQDRPPPKTTPEDDDISGIGRKMLTGSAWMIGMRWSVRSIGLLSTIILARLLLPEDFGIVAMAAIVYGLLEALSQFGLASALIQNRNATRGHYDTAWTVQLIQFSAIAVILLAVAPYVARYFDEPRVAAVVHLLALAALIGGFENIGVVDFQKNLQFGRFFRYSLCRRLLTFVVTIGLAAMLRDYWALAIGLVAGQAAGVGLSYAMHPYRPRLSLGEIRSIWGFSQWMLVGGIAEYLLYRADQVAVGRIADTETMGAYHVGSEISSMATGELALPIARALFPSYAKIKHDVVALGESFLQVQALLASLCLAAGFGLAAVADDMVLLVLGARWSMAAPFIQWLAIAGGISVLTGTAINSLLVAIGHVRRRAALVWFHLAILVPGLLLASALLGVEGIAIARLATAAVFAPLAYWAVCRALGISVGRVAAVLWRPLTAASAMFFAVRALHSDAVASTALRLVSDIATGTAVYIALSVLLWWLAGRPEGAERMIFRHLVRRGAQP